MRIFLHILLLSLFSSLLISRTDGAISNAMSIDLGTEFLKMALVKPGVPMEIVLNRESHRKTPFALTIRKQERYFGDEALKKAISAPRHTFTFFLDLVGKQFSEPIVADYQKRFPHLELKQNEQRGTVNFVTDAGELPLETMLAMVLANARAEVETYAGQSVKDVVISVPALFDPAQRKTVETAAQIAGLNLIQLLSAGASAGLNYGVFRVKDITEEPQTHLIYDVGSTKVQATVLRYQLFNETQEETAAATKKSAPAPIPKVEVLGYGFNEHLGGHMLTLKLRDYLVEQFRAKHPNTEGGADITTSPQAMAKLLKEAGRVKQVLSANMETFAQVESVFQDIDFRTKVVRAQLEEMLKEFEEPMIEPIRKGLEMAQLELDKLDKVLLMGAGTRVPKVQELLGQFFSGKQLGRNLNTDEAIALGAVYQAARKSKNFVVKRFDVVDSEPPVPAEAPAEELKQMSEEEIGQAKQILADFDKLEKAKAERDHAMHSLESAVFDYTYKLDEDEFKRFGTGDELDAISKMLAELREWLEEVPEEMGADQLKEKKRDLMKPIRKLKNRKRQKEDRPEYIKNMDKVLEDADKQLAMFRNATDVFTDALELDTFNKMITETREWFETVKSEAEKLADNQDATFTTDDLKSKGKTLDREAKFLFNKVIIALRQKEETERAAKKLAEEEEAAKKKAEEEEKAKAAGEGENAEAAEKAEANTTATNGTAEEGKMGAEGVDEGLAPVEVDETKEQEAAASTKGEEEAARANQTAEPALGIDGEKANGTGSGDGEEGKKMGSSAEEEKRDEEKGKKEEL